MKTLKLTTLRFRTTNDRLIHILRGKSKDKHNKTERNQNSNTKSFKIALTFRLL